MLRASLAFLIVLIAGSGAFAQSASYWSPGRAVAMTPPMVVTAAPPPPMRSDMGGGFIEFLFGNHAARRAPPRYYGRPAPQPWRRSRA